MRGLLAVVVLVSGCDLYFTDGPCDDGGDEVAIPVDHLRDPLTGSCAAFSWPSCDERCGPCPAFDAPPDWGSCSSACEGLAESTCMATPGCYAAYTELAADDRAAEYRGCWQTAPSGPVGGSCANLDAYACSRHDNCTAHYKDNFVRTSEPVPVSEFLFCAPEVAASCAATTCGPGTHCEEMCTGGTCTPACVPDQNLCAAVDCLPGYECVQTCEGGNIPYCDAQCVPSTMCEALATEAACSSRIDCVPVYQGDDCTCYPGYCECNILTYDHCQTK